MSEDEPMGFSEEDLQKFLNEETINQMASMSAGFDQFKAAVVEVAQTVCVYRKELRAVKCFTREEQFMLTMDYQTALLHAILHGNFGEQTEQ